MASEQRLNEILDVYEQALAEGDAETAAKAKAAYKRESAAGGDKQKKQPGKDYDDLSGENALTRGAMGFARPIVETVYGAKQLVGKGLEAIGIENSLDELTPDQQRVLDTSRQDLGTAGTVGRVAGEVATYAVPGGAAGKIGTKLAMRAPQALKYAPAIADVATVAGMEAAKSPTDERSRVDAALEGAMGGAAGRAIAAGGGVLLRGLKPAEQAKKLIEYGRELGVKIELTPGQLKGGAAEYLENLSTKLPLIAQLVGAERRAALKSWNQAVLADVSDPLTREGLPAGVFSLPEAGASGISRLQGDYSTAYEWLLRRPIEYTQRAADNLTAVTAEVAETLPAQFRRNFKSDLESFIHRMRPPRNADIVTRESAKRLDATDDLFRARIRAANKAGNKDVAAAYDKLRTKFREYLDPDAIKDWTDIDAQYRRFVPVRAASNSANAAKEGGVFTPAELMRTSSKLGREVPDLRARATEAGNVLGYTRPENALGSQIVVGAAGALLAGPKAVIPALLAAGVYNPITRKLLQPRPSRILAALKKAGIDEAEAKRMSVQLAAAITKAKTDPTTEEEFVSRLEALQQKKEGETARRSPVSVLRVEETK